MTDRRDPSQARWRTASSSELLWVEGDDHDIVYHRPSGRTHFVNVATRHLLLEVLQEPRDLPYVIHGLAAAQGVDAEELSAGYVAGMLRHLEELGLIRRL